MGHDSHVAMIAGKSGGVPSKLALARSQTGVAAFPSAPHTLHPRRDPRSCCQRREPANIKQSCSGIAREYEAEAFNSPRWSAIYPMVDSCGKVSSSQNENVES